jgi:hypothetical protein
MALSYIPQGQRFVVVEGVGCSAAILPSLPAILIVYMWPVILAAVSIVYGGELKDG